MLGKRALEVWSNITTEYELAARSSEYIYLSDDYDFTGHKPEKFVFLGEEYTASDWAVLYRKVLDTLFNLDPSILINISQSSEVSNISQSTNAIRKPYKLQEGIIIETNLSTRDIIGMLKLVFEKYQLDENELGILLRK